MRFLSWLIGLPVAIIVVAFALSNRHDVVLGLWPFEEGLGLPIFLAVLLPLLTGFVLGYLVAGWRSFRRR